MSERTKKILELTHQIIITKQTAILERTKNEKKNENNHRIITESVSPKQGEMSGWNIKNNCKDLETQTNNVNPDQQHEKRQSVVNEGASTSKQSEINNYDSDESDPFSDNSDLDKNYEPSTAYSSSTYDDIESLSESNLTDVATDSNIINLSSPTSNNWQNLCSSTTDFIFCEENFEVVDEIKNSVIQSPIDVYKYFVSKEMLELIVSETNKYANQQLSNIHSNKSRTKSWVNTNEAEILKFLGVNIAMGLAQLPAIHLYWSKDNLYHNEFIASCITRDRFLLLLKFLHFCDNETADVTNRLYKIEPAVSILLENFQKSVHLGRILVIDESMIPFRGRLLFRQYIPNKCHKYGVKIYKLCTVNGYTYNAQIYSGKGDTDSELGHSQSVVLKLLTKVHQKHGRVLYADNFYSSIPLVEKLLSFNMLYCGTLRNNRKGVPQIFNKKMKKGEIFGMEKNNIKIIKWVDKRPVLMITSDPTHDDKLISTGAKNRNGDEILKPKVIIDYNKAKKGVDYSDQMASYHSAVRKSLKWYRKVMFELLLGSAVVNSWIIYNLLATNKLGITEFRRVLAEDLVNCQFAKVETSVKKRVHTFVRPDGPGRKKRRPCKGCYATLRKTLSSREATLKTSHVISYCQDCDNQPGFCLNCFNNFHK